VPRKQGGSMIAQPTAMQQSRVPIRLLPRRRQTLSIARWAVAWNGTATLAFLYGATETHKNVEQKKCHNIQAELSYIRSLRHSEYFGTRF
jgi:hypothetical protein